MSDHQAATVIAGEASESDDDIVVIPATATVVCLHLKWKSNDNYTRNCVYCV